MSNLQAAVGVAQLERLPQTMEKKRQIGRGMMNFWPMSGSLSVCRRAPTMPRISIGSMVWC